MPNQNTTKIAAIVIGLMISVLVVFMGFQIVQRVFTRAEDVTPTNVVVDASQNTARISWTTGRETQGTVNYGTTLSALNSFAPETAATTSHTVDLSLLSPNTTYYFKIKIGDTEFDNGGVPWTFTTKGQEVVAPTVTAAPSATPTAVPISCVNETDCAKFKENIGKGEGCTARDYYLKCINK